ncbi:YIP1 family protein [Desulfamplus magnetovallimortis]|nr:YIP1 family protein [Desulfamplus magnetovallimortis]
MVGELIKSCQFYGYAVIQILIEPRQFFSELPGNTTILKSLGFCVICSIFHVASSLLTGEYKNPVSMGSVLFVNSIGMVAVSSILSYITVVMILKKKVHFERFFSINAFASGVVLLFSWVSVFMWFTEPWKWWLVYTGLKNSCGFAWKSALTVLILTMVVQFFFIYSLYLAFYK